MTRVLLLMLGLVALAVQSLLVQTHLHAPRSPVQHVRLIQTSDAAPTATQEQLNNNNAPDKFPINDDPSNCSLCQVVTLASHYAPTAIILILLPSESGTAFATDVVAALVLRAQSHSWRGRAPPSI